MIRRRQGSEPRPLQTLRELPVIIEFLGRDGALLEEDGVGWK